MLRVERLGLMWCSIILQLEVVIAVKNIYNMDVVYVRNLEYLILANYRSIPQLHQLLQHLHLFRIDKIIFASLSQLVQGIFER